MAKGNAIAAAALAAAGNPGTAGSGPSGAGALSPLVASYTASYSVNRPYSPLPRPAPVFLDGAFGPGAPIPAMPIDPPREDTHRPDPRRFQYPVFWNMPVGQPGTEGIKLTSFQTLRAIADTYSVARSCVDKRKSEIVGLEWDIIPTDEAEHALMGDEKARADWEKRRAIVKQFFEHPDSDRAKYPTFGSWLNALLEDRFVIDAVAVRLTPPRRKGAGPFGSDLASLDLIDGTMIRPMLDTLGSTPKPPAVAFQAYDWGVPRVDLLSVITEADAEELGEPVAEYRADQMVYMRETPRAWTPYGFSAVEKALLPISIGLARQQWQSDYYSDGSVPAQWVTPGPDISTPQQIRQLQDALNAMAGDIGAKHRIIVLPPGSKADPQKPAALADQFDEWIISQVAMPFGLTPMDLGVTPRVSAVQTPSESRELSHINTDKGSQTRIEPVTSDLKHVLFDYVIQQVFKQKDMQFSWGLKDRGKNKQAIIDQGIKLIQNGAETIDEFRIDMGMTPYGLPETSVPLVLTATGPVPLQAVASEHSPSPDPAQPAEPGSPAAGGAPPKPPQVTDDELTTPAHEAARALPGAPGGGKPRGDGDEPGKTAKASAELEILARYLRKGRDPERFTPQHLPPEALAAAKRALPQGPGAAVKAARRAVEAKRRQERRDRHTDAAAAALAAELGRLVNAFRQEGMSLPSVIDSAVTLMAAAYVSAMAAGSADASGDYPDTPAAGTGAVQAAAQAEASGQRGFLTGLLQDVIGGLSLAQITARLGLFAATLRRAYNRAYGGTVMTAHPDYYVVWELGDSRDHCALCVARDGKRFKLDDLPGYPGDGGFGPQQGPGGQQAVCLGGPNCHCSCSFVEGGETLATGTNTQLPAATDYYQQQLASITAARQQATAARQAFTDSLPTGAGTRAMTRDQFRRAVADAANARIRAAGGYPGVSVEPQDIPADIIAAMLPPGMEGAAGLSVPQLDVAQAVERMFAAKAAVLDLTKAEFTAIMRGAVRDAAGLLSAPPADPERVYRQLAVNYEPRGIAWVRDLEWAGPVAVPLDRFDTGDRDSWAASEPGPNTGHDRRFEERIRSGGHVNPIVAVHVPGQPKLKIIDGHHRYEAYEAAGEPPVAFVGFADSDDPAAPWFQAHLYQVHSGGSPMNKTAAEDPTRVAFLLIRARGETGKWRYLLQKRADDASHGGTWGLPGGKTHEGETPWDAAVRESAEELGALPALVPAGVWSRAETGRVVWTFLCELPAVFTPEPGPEADEETAGWGWFRRRDVSDLPLHPAFGRTWEGLEFGEPLLGGEPAGTVKAARGYELNPRSGMISLDVPEGLIEPVPGGVRDFHLTVCYLGGDVDDEAFTEACRRAAGAAGRVPGSLSGVISGLGTFEPSDGSDGKVVAWAGVTLPGAETLREAVADLSASEHTAWAKHVTLAYLDPGDPLPEPVPATPVTFTHLSVHRGDEVVRFSLGGEPAP